MKAKKKVITGYDFGSITEKQNQDYLARKARLKRFFAAKHKMIGHIGQHKDK